MNATAIDTMDIIERLRASQQANVLTNEAADEIRRLHEVIKALDKQRALFAEKVTADEKTVALVNKLIAQMRDICRQL